MSIASLPSVSNNNKRTIRQAPNPLDKATIVSVYPRSITEIKPTIQPGVFHIEAGSETNPSLAVFGPSSWWRDTGEDMPLIEIPNSAVQIADSFIKDYANGLLMCDMDGSMPGLFFIPGDLTILEIRKNYSGALKEAITKQRNWFNNLVKLGDAGWSRTNGNPMAISDLMKMAAEGLGLNDREWMKASADIEKVKCIACGNLRNPQYPICPSCDRIVDLELAKKLGITDNK